MFYDEKRDYYWSIKTDLYIYNYITSVTLKNVFNKSSLVDIANLELVDDPTILLCANWMRNKKKLTIEVYRISEIS